MRTDTLLAHLINQTKQNVELLIELDHISTANGREILALLPSSTDNVADPPLERARALWDYHEDPNDLSFRAGDIIEIVAETNRDWWTGRLGDREGLFPSNYVEKLKDESYPTNYSYQPPALGPPYSAYPSPPPGPPPQVLSNPSYAISPPPPLPPQTQPTKLSTMVAQGAASGVGWGAGAAVGSGIINAIF